jgi:hypothetical protein
MDQRTPVDSTPYSSYNNPNTPGTPSAGPTTPREIRTPATPSADYMDSTPAASNIDWYFPNVEVTVVAGEPKYKESRGVIRDVFTSEKGVKSCKVLLERNAVGDAIQDTVTVPADALERIVPGKKDNVIIVDLELKGQTGSLVGIDNADGIVKMDTNFDIKIVDLHLLAKYRK